MANTNIQYINYSDTQGQIIDKLNNNFDETVELHGGTRGNTGPTGPDGPIGERGSAGATGLVGPRGTRWFVSSEPPSSLSQEGDYWIDSDTSLIYQLDLSGWNSTGYNIRTSGNLFSLISSTYSSGSGSAIVMDQILPKNYLFVLSDVSPESEILNELLSKFRISTDSSINDSPLLEFSRSDLENGTVLDYSRHPVFYWPTLNPNIGSLGLRVPGGTLNLPATGGFEANFQNLLINSQSAVAINYGSTGFIFATGGHNYVTPSEFNIISQRLFVTGGSAYFYDRIESEITLNSSDPHTMITSVGATSSMRSSRSGDTPNNLSYTVYHFSIESSVERELFLSTKGKLKTKKTTEGVTYSRNTPNYSTQSGVTSTFWYFVSRSSTSPTLYPSVPLDSGNIVVVNPSVPVSNSLIGVGLYDGDDFSWGGSGGLQLGESIDISIHNSSDSTSEGANGFKFIGVGTGGAGGTASTRVTLPFSARSIDLTVARESTGANGTTVYWKAYTPWPASTSSGFGGTGGSFTY